MFCRTERLLLRPAWREDAPALAQAIGDHDIVSKLATAPWPYGLADALAFIDRPRDPRCPDFLIFTRTRGAPRLIGGIGLNPVECDARTAEIGYWIVRSCWGLGFATEAGRALMRLADHGLKLGRLVAAHHLDNPASGNVLRKLGFTPTGEIVRRHSLARGEPVPTVLFERAAPATTEKREALAA